jgi:hypothetical protein
MKRDEYEVGISGATCPGYLVLYLSAVPYPAAVAAGDEIILIARDVQGDNPHIYTTTANSDADPDGLIMVITRRSWPEYYARLAPFLKRLAAEYEGDAPLNTKVDL